MSDHIHSVDDYFTSRVFDFVNIKADKTTNSQEAVIYCNNLEGFINHVMEKREVDDVKFKFGIDGGGKFLKLCLSIQGVVSDVENSKICKKSLKIQE